MVRIEYINEIRPSLENEFNPGIFIERTEAIKEAYRWGKELHDGQVRLSGEPYFETHCVWVASFIDKLVKNEAWTIAALLHDSVEDRDSNFSQIRDHFPGTLGEEVSYIVDGVTKISNPRDGSSRDLETLRKIARFQDPGVYLVKLADKSHNVLTLGHMPESKRIKKANEAIRAYGKLAGILNCYRWRRWLEDMAFPYAEAETYEFVRQRIDVDPRLSTFFINSMLTNLGKLMEEAGIEGSATVTVNGYWQSWQKLRRLARIRKASMHSFEALNDLVSFRLVLDDKDPMNCYRLLASVNRFFGQNLDHNRFDDYIACPQNGYRALQVTAWLPGYGAIEVAIATEEMEGENTWGIVYAINHGKDISHYRPIEIFTPTGGARFLAEGSTVLDAVGSIQQEFLLDKISDVQVNGNSVVLSEKIQPGDVIEVITRDKRIVPEEGWLYFVNPTTARNLRSVLAIESLKQSAEMGRKLLREHLVTRGILDLEDVEALYPERVDKLLEETGSANLDDLYSAIGSGAIRLKDLSEVLDLVEISKTGLNWTSINVFGAKMSNKPGVLARLAGMISDAGGNIVRSVNNTLSDGGFYLRLVLADVESSKLEKIRDSYRESGMEFEDIEIV
ncbi:MAG: HD domain-containing protein [Anaerolineaceae bacterium]